WSGCSLMNRLEQVGGLAEIIERELEEQALARLALRDLVSDGVVIIAAVLDGVVEDGGIGCEPGDRKFIDVAAEHARSQQVARNIVEPEALAQIVQGSRGFHDVTSLGWSFIPFAVRMACSDRQPCTPIACEQAIGGVGA